MTTAAMAQIHRENDNLGWPDLQERRVWIALSNEFSVPTFTSPTSARPLGSALGAELAELARDCAEENWDGYGAKPISRTTLEHAKTIVLQLAQLGADMGVKDPEISVSPSGSVIFDWLNTEGERLLLAVSSQGTLSHAFLGSGERREKGSTPNGDSIPETLQKILLRFAF